MANKLSLTASYIAVKFYGLTLNPKIASHFKPFTISFYEKVVSYLPAKLSWNQTAFRSRFWRNFFVWWEELLLPGDLMHIISRKYYVENAVQKAINAGCEQLVILGSGFDHNGALFAAENLPSFEIDTPSMIEHKRKMLTKIDFNSEYLNLCPIDPANQNIKEVLLETGEFDPNKKTVFLAEGFFDYLSLDSTRAVMKNITFLCPDLKLISTFFDLGELNFFHRFMFTSGVAMVGETLKLPLNRKEFLSLLNEFDIKIENETSYSKIEQDLISKMDIDLPVLKGFYILESYKC
ncbi:MAG: class I SAM-dependent methyltransferase [Balneola sp.]|nr:class I SAM-dependent methyltransferase [Balneola sp.]MBO6651779.1 class I SAM-dependent methyltransferase [Balneola sp.]MBO6711972.1 class I SAM-dependent methyltransferase [Balneola sp.]MBO6800168.1 class I SAM-dependent methyltransferase [Balneola sp.]MBO6871672.1 class I SAM-dependent methyltransferase [Balneola sp.]